MSRERCANLVRSFRQFVDRSDRRKSIVARIARIVPPSLGERATAWSLQRRCRRCATRGNPRKTRRSRDSTVQKLGGLSKMRALFSAVVLFSASAPAFAVVVPEPETLALLGVAAAAIILARRKK